MDYNLLTDGLDVAAVPDKFKDPETGAINIPAIINSYRELERKMSASMTMPSKSVEEYCIECTHGLFEPDTEINQRLHAKGLTEEQVQEVYDLDAERLMPMIVELAGDFQAEREVEKLIAHFGGKEQWQEISRQLLAYGQQHLPKDVLQNLSSSFEGVLALYSMMKGETPNYAKAGGEMRDKANGGSDMNELKSMMRDPKYWRDKDPAFVAKVTDGFKRIYKD